MPTDGQRIQKRIPASVAFVIVKSYHGSIQSRARVIYCHHLAKKRYAVGLELHSAVGTWADTSQPARAEV